MAVPQHKGLAALSNSQHPMSFPCSSSDTDLNLSPKLRFALGNIIEDLRHFVQDDGKPWNELEVTCRPEDPNGCMLACIIEWGHNQTINKWAGHPAPKYEYNIKVSEFLMYAGIETLFLGPKDKDSHTILYFTLRHNITAARERRKFAPGQDQRKGHRQNARKPASELWNRASFHEEAWDCLATSKVSACALGVFHKMVGVSALASFRLAFL